MSESTQQQNCKSVLLYHFGYRGDILVVGQHFARELRARFPAAAIDLMVRPRMADAREFMEPLGLFRNILSGEKQAFHRAKAGYNLSYMIDENVFPEGNLRTPFTKAAFPYRQHKLSLVVTEEDRQAVADIAAGLARPLIAVQSDMARKWPKERVEGLYQRLAKIGSILVLGPAEKYHGLDRTLTFRESAALAAQADLFVGIDSGIAHAAALMGVQTILLPPVFPEFWISPTEYANPFIADEVCKHVSLRPHADDFCGHYLCLRSTATGGIRAPGGNPLLVKCVWKKKLGIFKDTCCFGKISVDAFYEVVETVMKNRAFK